MTASEVPLCTCRAPPAVLTFPFLDERAREDAHEAGQADQLHGELLQDLVHSAVELGTARVPRVLNNLGQPKHRNVDVLGIPAGGTAPSAQLTDRVEAVLLLTQGEHWDKQVSLEKPHGSGSQHLDTMEQPTNAGL